MSKADLIESVAKKGLMSKAQARRAVDLVFGEIEAGLAELSNGGKLLIGRFGVFTVAKRPARTGNDPRNGSRIKIKAGKTLRFRPSLNLKKAVGI